ncbi:MAG: glycosyltransferase [Firmicutes bacterium]|nr:glycosyltransferase [Bacillota bacterium]
MRPLTLEGEFFTYHSFAHFNREIALALLARGVPVSLRQRGAQMENIVANPRYQQLLHLPAYPRAYGLVARHVYPPDFGRPQGQRLAVVLPWEYGFLPVDWIKPLQSSVDEVWVYSNFVRDIFLRSGIPYNRLHVVPCGVDPDLFNPEAPPTRLETRRGFRFLYVGGTRAGGRKGFDLLLRAYLEEFSPREDVCLVVKDFFYGRSGYLDAVGRDPTKPEVVYLYNEIPAEKMPGIYRACHCLVHPYRTEGFCLPVAEALACGIPTITSFWGPVPEYANADMLYFLRGRIREIDPGMIGGIQTVGRPFWFEPSLQQLRELMRHVYNHYGEAKEKARLGSIHIRTYWSWQNASEKVAERLNF